jgi:hypothetical protein
MDEELVKRLQKQLNYRRIQARKLQEENIQLHARCAAVVLSSKNAWQYRSPGDTAVQQPQLNMFSTQQRVSAT